jgi:hypothetical protein
MREDYSMRTVKFGVIGAGLMVGGVILFIQRRIMRWFVDQTTGKNVATIRRMGSPNFMSNYEDVANLIALIFPMAMAVVGIVLVTQG